MHGVRFPAAPFADGICLSTPSAASTGLGLGGRIRASRGLYLTRTVKGRFQTVIPEVGSNPTWPTRSGSVYRKRGSHIWGYVWSAGPGLNYHVEFTRDEVATFLDRVVNPTGGYAPAHYEADLKERSGTVEWDSGGFKLTYDESYRLPWAPGTIASTTFYDGDEAVEIFGRDVISDLLDGRLRRASYLTFRGE